MRIKTAAVLIFLTSGVNAADVIERASDTEVRVTKTVIDEKTISLDAINREINSLVNLIANFQARLDAVNDLKAEAVRLGVRTRSGGIDAAPVEEAVIP